MESIWVRNPRGEERHFPDQEQLARAFADGAVTAEWVVFESLSGQWVALEGCAVSGTFSATPAQMPRRSREIVLIFPSGEAAAPMDSAVEATRDPLDLVSILTPEEIDRVLGRRSRSGGPEATVAGIC